MVAQTLRVLRMPSVALAVWLLCMATLLGLSASGPAWATTPALLLGLVGTLAIGPLAGGAPGRNPLLALLPPFYSGALALALVQALLVIHRVPSGLIPTPTAMFEAAWVNRALLLQDGWQTFVLEALSGMSVGVLIGLLLAILIVRVRFLERGLLPYMVMLASLPVPAMAPLAVAGAGTGWGSKALLVVVVTIFPTVINGVRGMQSAAPQALDLLRSYGLEGLRTFSPLRLPAALPFLFTALKIDLTLALISAIVGEFFGSPGQGLGFRIKFEVSMFNMPLVWAAILYTTVLGLALYAVIVVVERRLTFWHPSMR